MTTIVEEYKQAIGARSLESRPVLTLCTWKRVWKYVWRYATHIPEKESAALRETRLAAFFAQNDPNAALAMAVLTVTTPTQLFEFLQETVLLMNDDMSRCRLLLALWKPDVLTRPAISEYNVLQRVLAFQSNDFLCRVSCYHRANPDKRWQCKIRTTSADICRKVGDLAWDPAMEDAKSEDRPLAYVREAFEHHIVSLEVPSKTATFCINRHEVLAISDSDLPLVIWGHGVSRGADPLSTRENEDGAGAHDCERHGGAA